MTDTESKSEEWIEKAGEEWPNEEMPHLYANSLRLMTTVWDIQICFGQVLRKGGEYATKWAVNVVQSPAHAKALHRILGAQIEAYEERYGKLPDALSSMTREETEVVPGPASKV